MERTPSSALRPDWPALCSQLAGYCQQSLQLLPAGAGSHPDEDAIHDVRVYGKRLRAAWQLLRPWQDLALCRQRNRALADLAGALAGTRDDDVVAQTLQRLGKQASTRQRQAVQAAGELLLASRDRSAALPTSYQALRHTLEQEQQLWLALSCLRPPRRWWQQGIGRLQQRASRFAIEARASHIDDAFHEWRKWVKYELYASQLGGLDDAARLQQLDELGSLLGKLHDLTELQPRLASLPTEVREPVSSLLLAQVEKRKQQALKYRGLW